MILTDSNILIDVIEADPHWSEWSTHQLLDAAKAGRVVINPIILAEVAPYSGELDDFLHKLEILGIEMEPFTNHSAYCAGVAFKEYRAKRKHGEKKSILPDFLIGGHAQILGATILTRDPRFYRAYFPSVAIIAPDSVT